MAKDRFVGLAFDAVNSGYTQRLTDFTTDNAVFRLTPKLQE